MHVNRSLALLLGATLLASPAAPAREGSEASSSPLARHARQPKAIESTEAGFAENAGACRFDAETPAGGRIHFDKRINGRPEDFWWPSPDAYLRAVYGDCGLRSCCKFCLKGKPCGDTCISRSFTCRKGCGCACRRPLLSEVPPDQEPKERRTCDAQTHNR